jgi:ribosome-associated heat shock protein Hsp15
MLSVVGGLNKNEKALSEERGKHRLVQRGLPSKDSVNPFTHPTRQVWTDPKTKVMPILVKIFSDHPQKLLKFYVCSIMEKVRVDKWIWSIRIFKSRTLATDACKAGKVRIGNTQAKPSTLVTEGDVVTIRKDGFNFDFLVLRLIDKRVGAAIAVTCYEDRTSAEERNKYNHWYQNVHNQSGQRERGSGRPTKRERRELDGLQDLAYDWEDAE